MTENSVELPETGPTGDQRKEFTSNLSSWRPRMPQLSRLAWTIIVIVSIIAVVLIVSLVSASFVYVEWDQWAFKKNTATNLVEEDEVYGPGRYNWGPSYAAVALPSTAQTVEFKDDDALSVFTTAGLQIILECSFQYQLPRESVRRVYDSFGLSFDAQIANIGKALLKNAAPTFSESDYYQDRDHISQVLQDALVAGIKNRTGINVKLFQLRKVTLPSSLAGTLLNAQVQLQTNLREAFLQNATVIRAQTLRLQQETLTNVTRIEAESKAEAGLIRTTADASALQIRTTSKQAALSNLFRSLNLTTSELKLAFLYASQLGTSTNTKVLVGVGRNTLITA